MMDSYEVVRSLKDTDILFFMALLTLNLVGHSSAHQTDQAADIVAETPQIASLLYASKSGVLNNSELQAHEVHISDKSSHQYSKRAAKIVGNLIQPQFPLLSQSDSSISKHLVQDKQTIQPHKIDRRGIIDNIFCIKNITTRTETPRGTSPPNLWHDSNPDHYDFSQYDNPIPNAATEGVPVTHNTSCPKNYAIGMIKYILLFLFPTNWCVA